MKVTCDPLSDELSKNEITTFCFSCSPHQAFDLVRTLNAVFPESWHSVNEDLQKILGSEHLTDTQKVKHQLRIMAKHAMEGKQ